MQITPDMTIASVVDRWPESARIFARYTLGCASCAISKSETIAQAAATVEPALVVLAVAEGTPIATHTHELRMLAGRIPVAVGGGIRPEELTGLGIRMLQGDPVEAARSITA